MRHREMTRILLSPPDVGTLEREHLLEAFDSNWIAPLGPHVDRFEREMCARLGSRHAVALSSGTAALHLALQVLGVGPGDVVVTSTLTFAATANAIRYVGATPVFVDSEPESWNMSPDLLARALERTPTAKAVLVVDIYGQCANYGRINEVARRFRVPVIEDAAESLGARYGDRHAGALGALGVLSFNGNKIITTSGGGMLVSDNAAWIDRARYLATQARLEAAHYEHEEVGYNYRLSNLLAALGLAQLQRLDEKVARRRAINALYRRGLAELPGISFMPEARHGKATFWLTALTIDPAALGVDRDVILRSLADEEIEARPTWKPMHLQPAYAAYPVVGGEFAALTFERGICLPSGSSMGDDVVARVVRAFRSACA
jgi:dTDP-4-amino-4,6-dideoxygalactose transaminase